MTDDDPIKFDWTADARLKLSTKYMESRRASHDDDVAERAEAAWSTLTRLKTRVVVKTEREAKALDHHLTRAVEDGKYGRSWTTPGHFRSFKRARKALRDGMAERGWGDFDTDTDAGDDAIEPGDVWQGTCPDCDAAVAASVRDNGNTYCALCGTEIPVIDA